MPGYRCDYRRPFVPLRALSPLCSQIDWLKSIGVGDAGAVVLKYPRVLAASAANLSAKYHFLTEEWGRSAADIEAFPQALTYSLTFLRSRAGFLAASGKADAHNLHRICRYADSLFAKQLAKRPVEEYQAFARAISLIEGGMRPGDPPRSLAELAEEATGLIPSQLREEVVAADKFWARNLEQVARDDALQARVTAARSRVAAALQGEGVVDEPPEVAAVEGASTAEAEIVSDKPADAEGPGAPSAAAADAPESATAEQEAAEAGAPGVAK